MHKPHTKLLNVIQNAVFKVCKVYSVQPVLSGQLALTNTGSTEL